MSCPICDADPNPKFRPFCSKRCADLDLGRWMTGSYRIETEDVPEPGGPIPDYDVPTH